MSCIVRDLKMALNSSVLLLSVISNHMIIMHVNDQAIFPNEQWSTGNKFRKNVISPGGIILDPNSKKLVASAQWIAVSSEDPIWSANDLECLALANHDC